MLGGCAEGCEKRTPLLRSDLQARATQKLRFAASRAQKRAVGAKKFDEDENSGTKFLKGSPFYENNIWGTFADRVGSPIIILSREGSGLYYS